MIITTPKVPRLQKSALECWQLLVRPLNRILNIWRSWWLLLLCCLWNFGDIVPFCRIFSPFGHRRFAGARAFAEDPDPFTHLCEERVIVWLVAWLEYVYCDLRYNSHLAVVAKILCSPLLPFVLSLLSIRESTNAIGHLGIRDSRDSRPPHCSAKFVLVFYLQCLVLKGNQLGRKELQPSTGKDEEGSFVSLSKRITRWTTPCRLKQPPWSLPVLPLDLQTLTATRTAGRSPAIDAFRKPMGRDRNLGNLRNPDILQQTVRLADWAHGTHKSKCSKPMGWYGRDSGTQMFCENNYMPEQYSDHILLAVNGHVFSKGLTSCSHCRGRVRTSWNCTSIMICQWLVIVSQVSQRPSSSRGN